jgi:hypothetical protein
MSGLYAIWAHGHEGVVSRIELTYESRALLAKMPVDARMQKLYWAATQVDGDVYKLLAQEVMQGRITPEEAEEYQSHLTNVVLHRAGTVDYRSNVDLTETNLAKSAFGIVDYRSNVDLTETNLGRSAELGDANGQALLGSAYHEGRAVPKNPATAAGWCRRAAERGNVIAQRQLAILHAHGSGVKQDFAESAKWYRLAAEQGDPVAQIGLAASYFRGDGLPQDYAAAAMWYEQAAQQGHANAQCALVDHYGNGLGVPRDDITALMWILAAGDRVTDENSALVPRIRDQLKSRMTQAQIDESERRAGQWRHATCYSPTRSMPSPNVHNRTSSALRSLGIIEEPSRWATLLTWQRHLQDLKRLHNDFPLKSAMIKVAEQVIEEKRQEQRR